MGQIPEPLIPQAGARVMSLTDGLSKMSKSAPSDQSRINLLDSKDLIADKIKRCKTDSFAGLEFDNAERPECKNLLSVYQIVSGKTKEIIGEHIFNWLHEVEECKDLSWGTFKSLLAYALIEHLSPIKARYQEITAEPEYLDKILSEGADRATELGDVTMCNVYQAMGFYPRRR
ncbi:PREDICTED: tryptophan--tRNA ligase, chloroplastic/mitochondrial-like [Camelina sativa]|uniref:Tryptophan--tRNA ligase, chloroplastic/mitochondrial-like n=1 Tax=Camelina sativa TaxID=90675 RepID=A0ABM1R059_CAMSA|nr:PREDICTED: tryptophan--tRNA ligase, chloroplastic/mitochondrial-like [Camelina sativa]